MKVTFKKQFKLGIAEFDEKGLAEFIEIPVPTGAISGFIGDLEMQVGFAFRNAMELAEKFDEESAKEAQKEAKAAKKEKKDKTEEEKNAEMEAEASTMFAQLAMGKADLKLCYKLIKQCCERSKATLNGTKMVTVDIMDMLPMSELKRILGYYVVNFTNISD